MGELGKQLEHLLVVSDNAPRHSRFDLIINRKAATLIRLGFTHCELESVFLVVKTQILYKSESSHTPPHQRAKAVQDTTTYNADVLS